MKRLAFALLMLAGALAQAQGLASSEPLTAERDGAAAAWAVDPAAVAAAAAALAAVVALQPESPDLDPGTATHHESGVASWYGKPFHGRKTASGERFDMGALTAAHPKLPFGSWVRVRNPGNGRSVDVRINDRGPHIKRRIIDLSRAAAEILGLMDAGTRHVEISVLQRRR